MRDARSLLESFLILPYYEKVLIMRKLLIIGYTTDHFYKKVLTFEPSTLKREKFS